MSDPTDDDVEDVEVITPRPGPGHPDFDDEHAREPSSATGEDPPVPVVDLKTVALDELALRMFDELFGDDDDDDDDDER